MNSPIAYQPYQHSISTSSAAKPCQRKRNRKYLLVKVVADFGFSLKENFTTKKIKSNHNLLVKQIHAMVCDFSC